MSYISQFLLIEPVASRFEHIKDAQEAAISQELHQRLYDVVSEQTRQQLAVLSDIDSKSHSNEVFEEANRLAFELYGEIFYQQSRINKLSTELKQLLTSS